MKVLKSSEGIPAYFVVAQKGDVLLGAKPALGFGTDGFIIMLRLHVQFDPDSPTASLEECKPTGENAIAKFKRITYYAVRKKYGAAQMSVIINRNMLSIDQVEAELDGMLASLLDKLAEEAGMELIPEGVDGILAKAKETFQKLKKHAPKPLTEELKIKLESTSDIADQIKKAQGMQAASSDDDLPQE